VLLFCRISRTVYCEAFEIALVFSCCELGTSLSL
jgi:hypothetical protein